jgi:chromosome segregation ATPase
MSIDVFGRSSLRAKRQVFQSVEISNDGSYDFKRRKLCNIGTPTDSNDAITLSLFDTSIYDIKQQLSELRKDINKHTDDLKKKSTSFFELMKNVIQLQQNIDKNTERLNKNSLAISNLTITIKSIENNVEKNNAGLNKNNDMINNLTENINDIIKDVKKLNWDTKDNSSNSNAIAHDVANYISQMQPKIDKNTDDLKKISEMVDKTQNDIAFLLTRQKFY